MIHLGASPAAPILSSKAHTGRTRRAMLDRKAWPKSSAAGVTGGCMTRYLGRRPQAGFKRLPHVESRGDVLIVNVAEANGREIWSPPGRGVLGEVDGVPEPP